MVAMSVKLLNERKTDLIFKNDPVYQALKQQRYQKSEGVNAGVNIQALELKYGATANAAFTELGSAAPNEFDGSTFEKTTILCDTRVNTPGSSYFHFSTMNGTTETLRYAYFTKYEVFTVVCLAAASITTGTYFLYTDSQGSATSYYVWMDKNGDGTTDDPGIVGPTGVACDISAATTADDVGVIVAAAIDALAGTGASNTTGTVTVTMATKGNPTDAVDVDTTFVITVTEAGGADPGVSGTGAECDIKASTTAANVATVLQGVMNTLADMTAGVSTATVTAINDTLGDVSPSVDGNTGFTITTIESGADLYQGAPLYLKSGSANDGDAAAKHMRKDQIIGYAKDSNGVPSLKGEEVSIDGTTVVKTSELKWIRLIHHKGIDWGSGDADAAGIITVESLAGVDFQLIAAGANESEGGVIWVPNGFHCMIALAELDLNDIVQAITDGAVVRFTEIGFDETDSNRVGNLTPDNAEYPIVAMTGDPSKPKKWLTKTPLHGTDVAKLTITEAAINNVCDIEFKAYVLLWYAKDYNA